MLARRGLAFKRRQGLGLFEIDPSAFGDPAAVILVAMPEVPHHPERDVLGAILHVGDQVVDEVVALPILEGAVALAGLLVVVRRPGGLVAAQMTLDPLMVVLAGLRGLRQSAHGTRLVVHVLALPGPLIHVIGHLTVTLIGLRPGPLLRGID